MEKKRYTVWLYPQQITKLKTIAGRKELSVSEFIRRLIEKTK